MLHSMYVVVRKQITLYTYTEKACMTETSCSFPSQTPKPLEWLVYKISLLHAQSIHKVNYSKNLPQLKHFSCLHECVVFKGKCNLSSCIPLHIEYHYSERLCTVNAVYAINTHWKLLTDLD